ncbi:MAG: ABC transporter permease subunit [Nannocystaceae bacterium]
MLEADARAPALRRTTVALVGLYVVIALGLPLARLGAAALDGGALTSVELAVIGRAGLRSLALAGVVAAVAGVFAYPLARVASPAALVTLVLVSPLARALGVLELQLPPGLAATLLAQLAGALPLAGLVVALGLRAIDPAWSEAARDLGARRGRAFTTITLPLLAPALGLAALWAGLSSIGDVTSLELAGGGHSYGLALALRDAILMDDAPTRAFLLCAVLVALALPCAAASLRALEVSTTRRAPWRRPASLASRTLGGIALLLCLTPLLGLALGAVRAPAGHTGAQLSALVPTTLAVVGATTAIAAALGFALAFAPLPGRLAALVVTPLALPQLVQGIFTLELGELVGARPGLALTIAGLLPASAAVAYAGARLARAAVPSVLEDSARDLGAARRARLRWLWWPLLAGAALGIAGVIAALQLGAVDAPAFTSGPGGSTLAIGMTIVARGSGAAAVHRLVLALSIPPLAALALLTWLKRQARPALGGPR